jgi:hypothetical protein
VLPYPTEIEAQTPLCRLLASREVVYMKRLIIIAVGLLLLAGCTSNQNNSGGAGAGTTVGISGGATGTPSGTSLDPLGAGGGGGNTPGKAPINGSTAQP